MLCLVKFYTLMISQLEYQVNQDMKMPHNVHHYCSILHNSESNITTMTKKTKPLVSQMQHHANTLCTQIKIHSS